MKRIIILILTLALSTPWAGALAQTTEPLRNTELPGHETLYRLYDREVYEAASDHPGQVVRLDYTTQVYDRSYKRYVNVYLPYGYDEGGEERYPVLYFLHGNGCDQTTLIGNPYTVNAFDHMIENGDMPPVIIVAPTYFYDVRKKLVDAQGFVQELRTEIMPLVESTYRTYALAADEAGFRASRDMRAICGFSRGSMMTWTIMVDMVDVSRTFLPFSAVIEEEALAAWESVRKSPYGEDFFVYTASGGPEDGAYEDCVAMAKIMLIRDDVSFGNNFSSNNFFYLASDNPHQDLTTRYYLYNAFLDGLWTEKE